MMAWSVVYLLQQWHVLRVLILAILYVSTRQGYYCTCTCPSKLISQSMSDWRGEGGLLLLVDGLLCTMVEGPCVRYQNTNRTNPKPQPIRLAQSTIASTIASTTASTKCINHRINHSILKPSDMIHCIPKPRDTIHRVMLQSCCKSRFLGEVL